MRHIRPRRPPIPGPVAEKEARRRKAMPPGPGRHQSVWGPEAEAWAKSVRRRARRLGANIGIHAFYDLRRVRHGIRPASYRLWKSIEDYLARVERERAAAADLAVPTFRVSLENGLQLRRRGPAP